MAYESKATIKTIKAESKTTIKIRDNFYSVTYSEERSLPDTDDVDFDAERALLWNDVNKVVDEQAEEIVRTFAKSR